MLQAMSDLEKYMNAESDTDALIQAALIHYQFETIHPFYDGNGRVGRLLIMLFLLDRKILTTPAVCLSYFLKKYRSEYYARLSDVRLKGDFEQWLKFFLRAINESALDAIQSIDELSALRLAFSTVPTAINKLVALGILAPTKNVARRRVFAYMEYLKIFRRDT